MMGWLILASAVLFALAFPPWNLAGLIWIALVPWLVSVARASSWRVAVLRGLAFSALVSCFAFYWVAGTLREFGEVPWIAALLGFGVFAPLNQPVFTLMAPVFQKALPGESLLGSWRTYVGLALLYTGVDALVPKLFRDTLGHAFYDSPWIRQAADLGGAPLLTFAVMLVSLALARLVLRLMDRREASVWPALIASRGELLTAVLCVASIVGYGKARDAEVRAWMSHPKGTVQVALIQGNIGDFDKIASERGVRDAARRVMDTHFRLSDEALQLNPKPDLIIWPETSYPSTFRTPMTSDELSRDQQMEQWARTRGVPLLFGGYDRFRGKDYNAFFFLQPRARRELPGGQDLSVYRKNILLMFGEYIPGSAWIPQIGQWFPQVGNFGRGVGPEVIPVPVDGKPFGVVHTGPIICYEALFPDYVLDAARQGSQLIVNVTNDSWFGPTAEPELHLALVRFRSIESRLPQLRGTNTGISALILPDGSMPRATGIFREAILNVEVPVLEPLPTRMLRWGDWFGPTALVLGLALLGIPILRRQLSRS